ncbi:hypothetical protein [Aquirufa sp.]|jgi:hypothetical protein|uniref:hypothetical protein n=1 Tax=Aquirufa sp. TaxID=2676249 RepID=UPI0037C1AFC2
MKKWIVLLAALPFACSKMANDPGIVPAPQTTTASSFDLLQDKLLTPSCASSGCHLSNKDAGFAQHRLVLAKGSSYANLVGVPSVNSVALKNSVLRVRKFASGESLFFHKLNWDLTHHGLTNYGAPMPLGGKPISKGALTFVQKWIDAGAPSVGVVADARLLDDTTPSYVPDANFTPLATPSAEGKAGVQLKVDRFLVPPNFERELFVRRSLNNAEPIYISRIKLKSRVNSHHMVLYDFRSKTSLPAIDEIRDLRNLDNSLNFLTFLQMSNHIFLGGGTDPNSDYTFPAGMAIQLPANASIDLNPHYFNKTTESLYGENYVNLYTVPADQVKKVVQMIDFSVNSFTLPANQKTTITRDFKFDKPVAIVSLTSHFHARGKLFQIKIKGGARDGELVYENTDWEHPKVINYDTPILLQAGEGLTSVVTYLNDTSKPIGFGLTSEDEMNIIFGYYYGR